MISLSKPPIGKLGALILAPALLVALFGLAGIVSPERPASLRSGEVVQLNWGGPLLTVRSRQPDGSYLVEYTDSAGNVQYIGVLDNQVHLVS